MFEQYLDPLTCANCGAENEVATHTGIGPGGGPGDHSFAICWTCGALHEKRGGVWYGIRLVDVDDDDARATLRHVVETWMDSRIRRGPVH